MEKHSRKIQTNRRKFVIGVTNSPLGPYFNLANRVRVTLSGGATLNPWAINIYNAYGKLMFNLGEVTALTFGNLSTWTQSGNIWESQIILSNYQISKLNQLQFQPFFYLL